MIYSTFYNCPENFDSSDEVKVIISKGLFAFLKNIEASPVSKPEVLDIVDFYFRADQDCLATGDESGNIIINIANAIDASVFWVDPPESFCYYQDDQVPVGCIVEGNGHLCQEGGNVISDCSTCDTCLIDYNCNATTNDCEIIGYEVYTNITACTTISIPGLYKLESNLIGNFVNPCISITANDVLLDCTNFKINSTASDYVGIRSTADETIIRNCDIQYPVGTAIFLNGATNALVEDSTFVPSKTPIYLESTTSSIIDNNIATGGNGSLIINSSGNIISSNNFGSNSDKGLAIKDSSLNNITANTFSTVSGGSFAVGMHLYRANSNIIYNNDFDSISCSDIACRSYGIYLDNSLFNLITYNDLDTISGLNSGFGIVTFNASDNNSFYYNDITTSDLGFVESSHGNEITNNTACGVTLFGFTCRTGIASLGDITGYPGGAPSTPGIAGKRSFGYGNFFDAVKTCPDGWPVLGTNYSLCP